MLDIQKLLLDGSILIAAFSALVFYVGRYKPRLFLTKQDAPADILAAVPPQTAAEKRQARVLAIPLLLIMVGGVLYSTYTFALQSAPGFGFLFLHSLILVLGISLFDLVIIDWLVLNTITPQWAVFPGTEGLAGYKDYGFHGRAHLKALPGLVIAAALMAGLVAWLV